MIIFIFGLLATMIVGHNADTKPKNIIRSAEIIHHVNKNPENTWQADSYNIDEMDVDTFAKTRLGAKLGSRPPLFKEETPSSTASDTDNNEIDDLPVSFSWVGTTSSTSDDNNNIDKLPTSFNWVESKRTNCPIDKIRDQSNCGSCWAVSTAAAFSDRVCIKSKGKIKTPLSASYIMSCDASNFGCNGGFMDKVYDFLKYNGTVTGGDFESDEGCQPYPIRPCGRKPHLMPCSPTFTPKCHRSTCTNDWYPNKSEETIFRAKDWQFLKNETIARRELYNNGPITAAFMVYSDFIFYKSGIYSRTSLMKVGGHAVRVVGWGEEKGIKYWLVANSWGTSWGEKGYFRIVRGVNMCQFEGELQSLTPNI